MSENEQTTFRVTVRYVGEWPGKLIDCPSMPPIEIAEIPGVTVEKFAQRLSELGRMERESKDKADE